MPLSSLGGSTLQWVRSEVACFAWQHLLIIICFMPYIITVVIVVDVETVCVYRQRISLCIMERKGNSKIPLPIKGICKCQAYDIPFRVP